MKKRKLFCTNEIIISYKRNTSSCVRITNSVVQNNYFVPTHSGILRMFEGERGVRQYGDFVPRS